MKKIKIAIASIALFLSAMESSAQNTALNFDGTNDYVQTTYSGISGNAARSIEAWIKTTGNFVPGASGGQQGVIADYGTAGSNGTRFTFCVLWANAIRIEVQGNGLSGTIPVNDGNWHHVAVVYNPTASNKYSLYVDSVLDVSGNLTVATNTGTTTNLRIGQRIDNINNFPGEIDEVRFFNYARTASEIATERNSEYCSTPTGLVAYYKFNEGTAGGTNTGTTTAIDYAGINNGTLTGFSLLGSASNYVSGNTLAQGSSLTSSSVSTCGSYTLPSGTTVSTSGTYNDTLVSAGGCDSILSYVVTISTGHVANTTTVSQCDTFVMPNGSFVTSTGVYYDTLSTSSTCDTVDRY
ncbi:MAG: LamG domain-containing protein, partial [Flavobacteriales bacterium]